jgi:hypothetical protein
MEQNYYIRFYALFLTISALHLALKTLALGPTVNALNLFLL